MKKIITLTISLLIFCSSFLYAAELLPQTNELLGRWASEDAGKREKVFKRLQELNRIILLRSGMALRYSIVLNKTQIDTKNTKEIYDTANGAAIVSSNIHHIHTILNFITAIIAMQESGASEGNTHNSLFKSSSFIFENYIINGFEVEFKFIKDALIYCQKTPEPISSIAKDTLRDFEECKTLIMSIAPVQANNNHP